jgi:hypothetical protein
MLSKGETMASLREVALGWNPEVEPTEEQYDATVMWLRMSSNRPLVTPFQEDKIRELVRRFKAAHPEVYGK